MPCDADGTSEHVLPYGTINGEVQGMDRGASCAFLASLRRAACWVGQMETPQPASPYPCSMRSRHHPTVHDPCPPGSVGQRGLLKVMFGGRSSAGGRHLSSWLHAGAFYVTQPTIPPQRSRLAERRAPSLSRPTTVGPFFCTGPRGRISLHLVRQLWPVDQRAALTGAGQHRSLRRGPGT